jgi:hypothetical protein
VSAKACSFANGCAGFIVINVVDTKHLVYGSSFKPLCDVKPNYSFREVLASGNFRKEVVPQNFGQPTGYFLALDVMDVPQLSHVGIERLRRKLIAYKSAMLVND